MRAWGRLLRLSLAPSAAADIAAGALLGAGDWPAGPEPWLVIGGSLCVYHGGMALNDWADRHDDEALRPDRPIPSGAVAPRAALGVALALLAGGPLLALTANRASAVLLAFVAALAIVYDLRGRGPWRGPLLLAGCRAGNLLTGVACGLVYVDGATFSWRCFEYMQPAPTPIDPVVGLPWSWWVSTVPVALVYGAYVFTVSRLGRLEDVADERALGRRPSLHLVAAILLLCTAPLTVMAFRVGYSPYVDGRARWEWAAAAGLLGWAVRAPFLASRRTLWTRADVVRAMGMCLRRLLVFTALVALAVGGRDGWLVAAAILAGYPISYVLRGVFPPS